MTERVRIDISFDGFDKVINTCLERCQTQADCDRLTKEMVRILKITAEKERIKQQKLESLAKARQYRWNKTQDKASNLTVEKPFWKRWYKLSFWK